MLQNLHNLLMIPFHYHEYKFNALVMSYNFSPQLTKLPISLEGLVESGLLASGDSKDSFSSAGSEASSSSAGSIASLSSAGSWLSSAKILNGMILYFYIQNHIYN